LLQWNAISRTNGYYYAYVYRANIVGGTTNSFSFLENIGRFDPPFNYQPFYIDYTSKIGSNYAYYVQVDYYSPFIPLKSTNSCNVTNTATPVIEPLSVNNYSYTNQPNTNTAIINMKATQLWWLLKYTSFGNALSPNQIVAIFPTSNSFVISSNLSCGSPVPVFLSAMTEPVGSGPVSIGVAGASGFYSAKSLGYLAGNTNGPPKGTNFSEAIFYTKAPFVGSGTADITTNFPPLRFPRGSQLGYSNWFWQLSRQYEFSPTNCPNQGFIYYK
jgi:hypothetical protein